MVLNKIKGGNVECVVLKVWALAKKLDIEKMYTELMVCLYMH